MKISRIKYLLSRILYLVSVIPYLESGIYKIAGIKKLPRFPALAKIRESCIPTVLLLVFRNVFYFLRRALVVISQFSWFQFWFFAIIAFNSIGRILDLKVAIVAFNSIGRYWNWNLYTFLSMIFLYKDATDTDAIQERYCSILGLT